MPQSSCGPCEGGGQDAAGRRTRGRGARAHHGCAQEGVRTSQDPAASRPAGRTAVLRRLLHVDALERERALQQARRRGWLGDGQLVVTALAADGEVIPHDVRRLASFLQAESRGSTWAIGAHEDCLILVTSATRAAADGWDLVGRLSAHPASSAVAVGMAEVEEDEDDLVPAVVEAVRAARAAHGTDPACEAVGGRLPIVMLLKGIDASSAVLRRATPGAFALWNGGDEVAVRTVETYLDAGGRVSLACQQLHIHRTTLYYRLENLPEVVREELADGWRRSVLHLVLKLLRLRELEARADAR